MQQKFCFRQHHWAVISHEMLLWPDTYLGVSDRARVLFELASSRFHTHLCSDDVRVRALPVLSCLRLVKKWWRGEPEGLSSERIPSPRPNKSPRQNESRFDDKLASRERINYNKHNLFLLFIYLCNSKRFVKAVCYWISIISATL